MAKLNPDHGLKDVRWGWLRPDGSVEEFAALPELIEFKGVESAIDEETLNRWFEPARLSIESLREVVGWWNNRAQILRAEAKQSDSPSLGGHHSPITGREPALSRKHGG